MEQKIKPLTDFFVAHNEKQRAWVRDHFIEDAEKNYAQLDEKLRLLNTIIRSNWIEPHETWKLQSLGVTFGDALAQKLGMEWVTVEDQYGEDPALQYPRTSVLVFPLTTISKRIERHETVDVHELFSGICDLVTTRVAAEKSKQN